jgi:hypothetical protein
MARELTAAIHESEVPSEKNENGISSKIAAARLWHI